MKTVRNSASNLTNRIVRASGVMVFMATVVYFLFVVYTQKEAKHLESEDALLQLMYAFLPIPIFGFMGLYIAWIGEEPDEVHRRYFRKRGLVICLIGVAEILVGIIILFVFAQVSIWMGFAAFVEASTFVLGIGTIFFGLLAFVMGRDPKTLGWKGTQLEQFEKEHGRCSK